MFYVKFLSILMLFNISFLKADDTLNIKDLIHEVKMYYPELNHTNIIFTFKNIHATAQVRPTFKSFFKKKGNRTYIIIFNKNIRNAGVLWEYSDSAKIGIIGHELAHICYFIEKSAGVICIDAVKYIFSNSFHAKYEKNTDVLCIKHGLGKNLYKRCTEKLNHSNFNEKYIRQFKKYYLSCEEILDLL